MSLRIAKRYCQVADRYKKTLAVFFVALFALSLFSLTRTVHQPLLDTDLSHLLPEQSTAVQNYRTALARYGSTDHLYLRINGTDSAIVQSQSRAIGEKLRMAWPEILTLHSAKDDQFFRKHALLYLDNDKLQSMVNLLRAWRDCQRGTVSCPTEFAPQIDLTSFAYPEDVQNALSQILQKKQSSRTPGLDLQWDAQQHRWTATLQIRLAKPATDPVFSAMLMRKARHLTDSLSQQGDLEYALSGAYTVGERLFAKIQKIAIAGLGGLLLLMGMIVILRPRTLGANFLALGTAVIAVLSGASVNLALLLLSWEHLDLFALGAWLLSMGVGLGIAFSLALSILDSPGHFARERIVRGLAHWIWPLGGAGLALVIGSTVMMNAGFAGYRAFGMVLVFALGFLSLWSLAVVPWLCLLVRNLPRPKKHLDLIYQDPKSRTWAFLFGTFILLFGAFYFVPKLQIQPDAFARFRIQEANVDALFDKTLGDAQTIIVLADEHGPLSKFQDLLGQNRPPMVRSLLSLRNLYPSAVEQEERTIWVEDLARLSSAPELKSAPIELQQWTNSLSALVVAHPFAQREIPAWSLDLLREKDGTYGKIALLSAQYPLGDLQSIQKLRSDLERQSSGLGLRFASPDFLYLETVQAMHADKPFVIWGFALMLVSLLLWNWHNWRLVLQPLLLGSLWLVTSAGLWLWLNHTLNLGPLVGLGLFSLYGLSMMLWSSFPTTSPRNPS